ncbi:MAG: polysaccharide biosynthesis protein [Leptolyngbyaceae cyanobacterium bins.302]|nr:polysaccharide biosynthesis protein [Leptolyngbyaceae cyanobacterium bins.302]
MQPKSLTRGEIIAHIQQLVPPGSPEPQSPALLEQLSSLTEALIRDYEASGGLQGDPFNEAWTRPLYLYEEEVRRCLRGKTVLVTGGEGFVGRCLIDKLLELGVNRVCSIDNARCNSPNPQPIIKQDSTVIFYPADVRHLDALEHIFKLEKPDIVFHLAAIRIPGLAEKIILETVSSNIIGTENIIQLCEAFKVQHCIFSSTGKSSRYWTGEVYAATKKVNEWLFARAAQEGNVQYGMVRFTHMLNNSSMCEQIDHKIETDHPINIHAPERYVVGQNVGEAVHLLLNALVFSQPKRLRFLLVRNLGWPTESLEVALYKIQQSGKNLPIYFQGIPPGYEESFFLGQVDWDHQTEINTLVNALETKHCFEISSSGDMIVSEVVPFAIDTLIQQLAQLKALCLSPRVAPTKVKQKLAELVYQVALTTFNQASVARSLQILKWGINLKQYERGAFCLKPYQPFIELIVHSLHSRITPDTLKQCDMPMQEFNRLLKALNDLPSLQKELFTIQSLLKDSHAADLTYRFKNSKLVEPCISGIKF